MFIRPIAVAALTLAAGAAVFAYQPEDNRPPRQSQDGQPEGPGGPGGPGGGFGPGGPGRGMGPMMGERKIVKQFDKDKDGRLNAEERKAAREEMKKNGGGRRGPGGPGGGPGGRGGFGGGDEKPTPGIRVEKSDVKPVTGGLYDDSVLRTIFLDFDGADWEDELSDFIKTDVDVPATMTVDGKAYAGVGVSFRGASSLMMVGKGSKRSLNINVDFTDGKQQILGHKTLNLLNAHEDSSFMHTVLYFHIAQAMKIPAPHANFVRVVINGENWGVYSNAEQFNKQMLADRYPAFKGEGARWKVPGSPGARGGLEYLGESTAAYKQHYEIKAGDNEKSWKAFADLCKTLNETPAEQLESALKDKLDVEGVLWFLALDCALINGDGYWVRASDYSIYLDPKGMFHILPHDANETMGPGMGPSMGGPGRGPGGFGPGGGGPGGPGGPGGGGQPRSDAGNVGAAPLGFEQPEGRPPEQGQPGGPGGGPGGPDGRGGGRRGPGGGGGGINVDPLVGLDDTTKPLRSKLLKVPAFRAKYLAHVKTIAETWLDWKTLGPVVEKYRTLIDAEIKADTKKLSSYDAFVRATSAEAPAPQQPQEGQPQRGPGGRGMTLKQFADQRRAFLLNHKDLKDIPSEPAPK